MTVPVVAPIDPRWDLALQAAIDQKTKPIGALGDLEALAFQLGRVQQTLRPRIQAPALFVFAADHGLAEAGVSAYPSEVTWQMVENFLAGGAAINVFARQVGLKLHIVDAGVRHDFAGRAGLLDAKVAWGTRNSLYEPAMTEAQCETALTRGAALLQTQLEPACSVVGFGEMGIGNTSAATLLLARLLDLSLHDSVGRGTGLDDAQLQHKQAVLAAVLARHAEAKAPLAALQALGGFEIAMMVGAQLAAARAGKLILVDGLIASAAWLVAWQLQPALRDYTVFCHRSAEPAHSALLAHVGANPLLDLHLRLGEGTGAALALPLLEAAAAFLSEMASFGEAQVSARCC